jgi:hypothetical protein
VTIGRLTVLLKVGLLFCALAHRQRKEAKLNYPFSAERSFEYGEEQKIEEQRAEAQQILDKLFSEHLLPFELSAHRIDLIESEEYVVRFHDSRLRSVDVSWHQGQCFKDVFRTGVLERVKRLSGPLHQKTAA